MELTTAPVARANVIIRVPVAKVFQAFVDPAVTSQFWFSRSDGPLELGKTVVWYFDMFGVSGAVKVLEYEKNARLLLEDNPGGARSSKIEFTFEARPDGSTLLKVVQFDLPGTGDEMVAQALDYTGGYNLVFANAKAWLEHGLKLNLVHDHVPGHG